MWARFNCFSGESYAIKNLYGIIPIIASQNPGGVHGWAQADYWVTLDINVPTTTLTACSDGDLFGDTAGLLSIMGMGNTSGDPLIENTEVYIADWDYPNGLWTWIADTMSGTLTELYTPGTTVTVEAHVFPNPSFVYGVTSPCHVEWYFNGTLGTNAGGNYSNAFNVVGGICIGGLFAEQCFCEEYYVTNVKVGSTRGASDYFSDNFSSGNFSAWTTVVGTCTVNPAPAPCGTYGGGTIAASPANGCYGDVITITGSGYTAGNPLTVQFNGVTIAFSQSNVDGSGNVHGTLVLPMLEAGIGITYPIQVSDGAVSTVLDFPMCCPRGADAPGHHTVLNYNPSVPYEYMFFNNRHWFVVNTGNSGTTPTVSGTTLDVHAVDDAGVETIYQLAVDPYWRFGWNNTAYIFNGNYTADCWVEDWHMYVEDARMATDGTNLWLAVICYETIPYPYTSGDDTYGAGGLGGFGSMASQFQPLGDPSTVGSILYGATSLGHGSCDFSRHYHQSSGNIGDYGVPGPYSDGGDCWSMYWSVPKIIMFVWNGSGFTRLVDEEKSKYFPGNVAGGTVNGGYQGQTPAALIGFGRPNKTNTGRQIALMSQLRVCASPAEPGVCHVIWCEAGATGRYGDTGGAATVATTVWDGCCADWNSRINHTKWSTTSKTWSHDLWHTHVDRTNWNYNYDINSDGGIWEVGYTYPSTADLAFSNMFAVKNDGGFPILFIARAQTYQGTATDPEGRPQLDYAPTSAQGTLGPLSWDVYNISTGTPSLLQSFDGATLKPIPSELPTFYGYTGITRLVTPSFSTGVNGVSGFGISTVYADPTLSGTHVYLLSVKFQDGGGNWAAGFYRIPVDASATPDYLDGLRVPNYTFIPGVTTPAFYVFAFDAIANWNFTSDGQNVWYPQSNTGTGGNYLIFAQLDKHCAAQWVPRPYEYPTVPTANFTPLRWVDGMHQSGDNLYYIARLQDYPTVGATNYGVVKVPICRRCASCACSISPCDGPIWFFVDGAWRQAGVDPDWNVYVYKDGAWHPVCTDPAVDAYVHVGGDWVAG